MPEFTFCELFSGIGGFGIAMHELGGYLVWACEKDRQARYTWIENNDFYQRDGKRKVPYNDIEECTDELIADHDILTAGFPCQSFSTMGLQGGLRDPRGKLFYRIIDIIKAKQPKAIILENVRGLVTMENGETLKTILKELDDAGYQVEYQIINSHCLVPQYRRRIYIVGFNKKYLEKLGDEKTRTVSFVFPELPKLNRTFKDVKEVDSPLLNHFTITRDVLIKLKKDKAKKLGVRKAMIGDDDVAATVISTYHNGYSAQSQFVPFLEADLELVDAWDEANVEDADRINKPFMFANPAYLVKNPEKLHKVHECYRCGGQHEHMDCPNTPCIFCEQDGHTGTYCINPAYCWICQKIGHIPNKCPIVEKKAKAKRKIKEAKKREEYKAKVKEIQELNQIEEKKKKRERSSEDLLKDTNSDDRPMLDQSGQNIDAEEEEELEEEEEEEEVEPKKKVRRARNKKNKNKKRKIKINPQIQGLPINKPRWLTPREYHRLQGFPESFRHHLHPLTAYKQAGNAVTPGVVAAIAGNVLAVLKQDARYRFRGYAAALSCTVKATPSDRLKRREKLLAKEITCPYTSSGQLVDVKDRRPISIECLLKTAEPMMNWTQEEGPLKTPFPTCSSSSSSSKSFSVIKLGLSLLTGLAAGFMIGVRWSRAKSSTSASK